MKSIRRFWHEHSAEIQRRGVFLFLDYDGTLTPIVPSPEKARLPGAMRRLLLRLIKTPGISVAVVSGRSVTTLRRFLKIQSLLLAGDHGCHISGPSREVINPEAAAFQKKIPNLKKLLQKKLRGIPGIIFEHKTYGLTINYNKVSRKDVRLIRKFVQGDLKTQLFKEDILLTKGKKVWEFRASGAWSKGDGVLWIISRKENRVKNAFPIYLGDDETDEDAFRALKKAGVGIRITAKPLKSSSAEFYLTSVKEVKNFLEDI